MVRYDKVGGDLSESSPYHPEVPFFMLRGAARAVDMVVHFMILEGAAQVPRPPVLLSITGDALLYFDVAVALLALILYTTVAEWLGGATLGKFLFRLQVVSDGGERVSFRAALIRSVAFFVDGFLLGLVAYSAMMRSDRRQRVGDIWAKTLVVWKRDAPPRSAVQGWPVGIALSFLMVLCSYVVS